MKKLRVLLVDDSAFVRSTLRRIVGEDPDLEVGASAKEGREALALLRESTFDVVVLDLEMPVMDGLQVLRELRASDPHTPVIMFSALTPEGGRMTLQALALGANDYILKPSSQPGAREALAVIREQLVPRIKALARHARLLRLQRTAGAPPPAIPTPPPVVPPRSGSLRAVAIGASTGGPNALTELLAALPAGFPAPVLVVQHMPATFTALLSERLDGLCALHVREAVDGARPVAGEAWIAPGDRHLAVAIDGGRPVLRLVDSPPVQGCRPAVDVLLESVARTIGPGALGVVLTGMGSDGAAGARALKLAGGRVLAQDAESSVVWGMPGAVVRAGLAEAVLPLRSMAGALLEAAGMRGVPA